MPYFINILYAIFNDMITIISATNRKDSVTAKVAGLYSELLNQINVENQVMYLCDLPADFMFSNFYGSSTQPFVDIVDRYINNADKFIVISPEYHGSYPGIFKALIDCVGGENIKTKKVTLVGVSTGRAGNLRGMEHLTALFHHLRAEVFSSKPKLSEIHKLFNEAGEIDDSDTLKLIQNHLKNFIAF